MDRLIELLDEIEEAKTELEELNESGDLESRLEAATRVEDLEAEHFREAERETSGL
tara:strand:+ start:474 stop:641 length:168 start_codon:yes stop_codon:yes gene_type:complete